MIRMGTTNKIAYSNGLCDTPHVEIAQQKKGYK